jgi:hypothetical protein
MMEQASYHTMRACVAAGPCFALCPQSILDLQRVPIDVRTQALATIDTYLVTRAAYNSSAYEELLRSVQTGRHFTWGSGLDHLKHTLSQEDAT